MRFHIGFSKRVSLKWILLILGGLLAFFGINNITALALEDGFTNRNIANIKYCSGAGVSDPNTSCDASSSTYQNTNTNGVIDSMAPVGVENSDTRRIPNAKTLFWIYSGVSQSGSNNPCNNPNTMSFNVTLSLNDINSVLSYNELNPNSYTGPPSPVITSMRDAVKSLFNKISFSSSSSYYQYTGINNSVGVFAGFRTGTGQGQIRNQTDCSFISYGSNKSINFRCTLNATLPSNSLYIGINYKNTSYLNNSSLYSNLRIYDAIKVQEINDPCNNNYASDSQGIVDSINGQSGQITQNTQDLIDSQNNINDNISDFKNNNHQDMEDLKDNTDAINDKLDDIKDSMTNQNGSTSSNTLSQWLNGHNSDVSNGVFSTILQSPLRLYQAIENADVDSCEGISLPISFGGASKTAVIPCGKQFWQQWPTNAVLIYHTIVFGGLAFGILMYLVKSFNGFLDPKDMSEIETTKL